MVHVVGCLIDGCTGAVLDDKTNHRGRGVDNFVII